MKLLSLMPPCLALVALGSATLPQADKLAVKRATSSGDGVYTPYSIFSTIAPPSTIAPAQPGMAQRGIPFELPRLPPLLT